MTASVSRGSRGRVLILGIALQVCLGTVYAWSYFQQPLVQGFGWTNSQVAWVFSLAICCLGLAAAVGGRLLRRTGPRLLASVGGALYGIGFLVAALALHPSFAEATEDKSRDAADVLAGSSGKQILIGLKRCQRENISSPVRLLRKARTGMRVMSR